MPTIFDIMKKMGQENKDIRLFGIKNVTRLDKVKKNGSGLVTIAVDAKSITELLQKKPMVLALIIADKDEFDATYDMLSAAEAENAGKGEESGEQNSPSTKH